MKIDLAKIIRNQYIWVVECTIDVIVAATRIDLGSQIRFGSYQFTTLLKKYTSHTIDSCTNLNRCEMQKDIAIIGVAHNKLVYLACRLLDVLLVLQWQPRELILNLPQIKSRNYQFTILLKIYIYQPHYLQLYKLEQSRDVERQSNQCGIYSLENIVGHGKYLFTRMNRLFIFSWYNSHLSWVFDVIGKPIILTITICITNGSINFLNLLIFLK